VYPNYDNIILAFGLLFYGVKLIPLFGELVELLINGSLSSDLAAIVSGDREGYADLYTYGCKGSLEDWWKELLEGDLFVELT
jgi:hypothetical protein